MIFFRIVGGIVLALVALGFFTLAVNGVIGATKGSAMYVFTSIFCVLFGVMIGRLSAMCFSPKYHNAKAEKDFEELTQH